MAQRLLNTLLISQRRNIFESAKGLHSYSPISTYFYPNLYSTKNPAWKFAKCGCLTRSFGLSNRFIVNVHSLTVRKYVTNSGNENPEPKPSLYQRFKSMYRDYWYVLLPVHMITSAAWYGGFYYLASSGVDIVALLENLNVSETILDRLRNGHSTTGYLAIAFALYKVATPLRYTVTVGGTTVSINYLKKWGYIKPVPSREKIKEMYEGRKEIFKEKGQNLKDSMIKSLKHTTSKEKKP